MEKTEGTQAETIKRVMLTVAYDGTRYNGWQIQPGGITIEGELIRAIEELLGEKVTITGASRTDAGVHSLCNKAVFDTGTRIPAEKLSYALNRHLPEDIRIQASCLVAPDFHPRRVESSKTYEYRICNARFPDPTQRLYSYFTYRKLNLSAMKKAASYLVGTHDFAAFSTYKPEVKSTVRTIHGIEVESQGTTIVIRVSGNGFLYHMVRIIAGTLLEVGMGSMNAEEIPNILEQKDRNLAGPTAPAVGLTMTRHTFLSDPALPEEEGEAEPEGEYTEI